MNIYTYACHHFPFTCLDTMPYCKGKFGLPWQWPTLANLASAFCCLKDCSMILYSEEMLPARTNSDELMDLTTRKILQKS